MLDMRVFAGVHLYIILGSIPNGAGSMVKWYLLYFSESASRTYHVIGRLTSTLLGDKPDAFCAQ